MSVRTKGKKAEEASFLTACGKSVALKGTWYGGGWFVEARRLFG
jgi:hypothetical protein